MKKVRNSSGVANDVLGTITGQGVNDANGDIDFAKILFTSPDPTASSERGAIYFQTEGAVMADDPQDAQLMDINGSTASTVTINGNLDLAGAITMAGAAFTAPITSNEAGEHSLGTQATEDERGEWQALHLWDSGATNAKITFGDGTDDELENNADVELEHIPTRGITINDDNRFQFRNNDTYIHSSNTDILNLVAPTLTLDAPTKVTLDAPIVNIDNDDVDALVDLNIAGHAHITNTLNIGGLAADGDKLLIEAYTALNDADVAGYTVKNTANAQDIVFFGVDLNGNDEEIVRVKGGSTAGAQSLSLIHI